MRLRLRGRFGDEGDRRRQALFPSEAVLTGHVEGACAAI
jgi:hypothetical protein